MTQYAQYDSTIAALSPVLGWYDTDAFGVPASIPAANLMALTPDQWAAHMAGLTQSWAVTGGNLATYAPQAPARTPAQQAVAAMAAGLAITSTSTPALSGTYGVDAATTDHIQSEMLCVLVAGTFADGTAELAWPDLAGVIRTFPSIGAFRAFALAVSGYVAALYKVQNGTLTALPDATATMP